MELDRLYQIGTIVEEDGKYYVEVTLARQNAIFDAHFPGNPILPGACIIDIVKCCAEKVLNKTMQTKSVCNLKFLQIIQPQFVDNLRVTLKLSPSEEQLLCKAVVDSGNIVFSKMDLHLASIS